MSDSVQPDKSKDPLDGEFQSLDEKFGSRINSLEERLSTLKESTSGYHPFLAGDFGPTLDQNHPGGMTFREPGHTPPGHPISGAESAPGVFHGIRENNLEDYEELSTGTHNIAIGEHTPGAIHTGKNGVCFGASTGANSTNIGTPTLYSSQMSYHKTSEGLHYNSGFDHSLTFTPSGERRTCVSFHPPGYFPDLPTYSISIHSEKRMGAVVMLPKDHPLCRKLLDLALSDVSSNDGIVVLNLESYNPELHEFPKGIGIHRGEQSWNEGR